jgi:NADPH-dependent 2,4-dienoyl-CoA reductase/sulfur reductase-like enzyme
MSESFDLLIIGAGPAGMAAAVRAQTLGLRVAVIDEQSAPGGQVWRAVEHTLTQKHAPALGKDYAGGAEAAARFRACGAAYFPDSTVWQVENVEKARGLRVFVRHAGTRGVDMRMLDTRALLIATGAIERPVPFPGWTLPGVMTVGAAQILLKTAGQIPDGPVWIAGNGPLLMLYVNQLLDAGGAVAGVLNTGESGVWRKGLALAGRALGSAGTLNALRDLAKGLSWRRRMQALPVIDDVTDISAAGTQHLESLTYRTASGLQQTVATRLLLVHEGLLPDTQLTHALDCRHRWDDAQQCFAPVLDDWGRTTQRGIHVAGDGGGIAGAQAARMSGEVAAFAIARDLGKLSEAEAQRASTSAREALAAARALRPMLDALYRPRAQGITPLDDTMVCRCESVTAGVIRAAIKDGAHDPNHVKAQTRCGMGPCLGRQCGTVLSQMLARATGRAVGEVGLARARPPLRPITLAELASLTNTTARHG